MAVLVTVTAAPLVVATVLSAPVTLTVPPPVAVKAAFAPVERSIFPLRLIVPPVLLVRLMPEPLPPVSAMSPDRVIAPPVRPLMRTACPLPDFVIEPG